MGDFAGLQYGAGYTTLDSCSFSCFFRETTASSKACVTQPMNVIRGTKDLNVSHRFPELLGQEVGFD